jgi:chitinase
MEHQPPCVERNPGRSAHSECVQNGLVLVRRPLGRCALEHICSNSARAFPQWLRSCALTALLLCAFASPARGLLRLHHGNRPRHLLVGYFTQSGIYYPAPFYVKNLVINGSAARLDQINFASGSVVNGSCSLGDPQADLMTVYTAGTSVSGKADDPASKFRGYFHQLEELKRRYPRLKILISLEGRAADFAQDAAPEQRAAFVSSCVNLFLRGEFAPGVTRPGLFDGVDIDWESPLQADAANFRALIEEFRRQMDALRPGLRLSVAVDQSPDRLPGTDFAALAPIVDEFGIMNYDYAGPWSSTTGFLAPLFASPAVPDQSSSIERSIASYKAEGIPESKLLMGLPFYGYGWTAVNQANHGLFQTGRAVRGDQPYHSIRTLAAKSSVYRDELSQAPWLFDGQDFWTYEDPVSVRYKVSYAASQHLGGVMIWELSGDTADAELLNSAYRALHHPLKARTFSRALAAHAQPNVASRSETSLQTGATPGEAAN